MCVYVCLIIFLLVLHSWICLQKFVYFSSATIFMFSQQLVYNYTLSVWVSFLCHFLLSVHVTNLDCAPHFVWKVMIFGIRIGLYNIILFIRLGLINPHPQFCCCLFVRLLCWLPSNSVLLFWYILFYCISNRENSSFIHVLISISLYIFIHMRKQLARKILALCCSITFLFK